MPLQNRVAADGTIHAHPMRGLFFGNRGGQFHDTASKQLHPTKRWASRQWICCVLSFKGRRRPVMGPGYTPLFFLDEVTAFAAGHRPCFECRRVDASDFQQCWMHSEKMEQKPKVALMDRILHEQRLDGKNKRTHATRWGRLPDGAVARIGKDMLARKQGKALLWTMEGYRPLSGSQPDDDTSVASLTPPAILNILHAGYRPQWHSSSNMKA